ncbi:diguanylate cyclase [Sulfurimonas sp.]|uniref:sensor domain-containing diguanylate cyclase n=1 Tax=Sulfurimonas sp. TaxID=2022749 RepID=UPI0019F7F544|nr:diguanylate cyclase [Sulfurimonas sp.]MBE0515453.1 diguanylate cyclase [Sulfurimonas sp.]
MSDIYKLKKINFIMLTLIFLIFLVGIITLLNIGYKSKYYAKSINIAGKQRVLSQKIIFELNNHFLLNDKNALERLKTRVSEYSSNEKELLYLIRTNIPNININALKDKPIKNFLKSVHLYIKAPNEKLHSELINNRDEIFDAFNNFVDYCEQSYNKIYLDTLKKLSIVGILNILLIIFYYQIIFKKSLRYLDKYLKIIHIEKNNMKNIFDAIDSIIFEKNGNGTYIFANSAFLKIFSTEIVGKNDADLFPKDVVKILNASDLTVMNEQKSTTTEIEINLENERKIFFVKKFPLKDENEEIKICGIAVDITLEKEFGHKRDEFNKIIDNHVIVSYADCNGIITDVSKAFCLICGYEKSELIGKSHDVMLDSKETTLINELWKSISLDNQWNGEFKNRKKDGSPFWIDGSIAPCYGFKGEKLGYIMVAKDISDRKIVEKLSITDALTNLYNRRFFDEIFQKKLSYAIREKNKFCLFMCDVDNFKNYNDMYGHQMGDKALITISDRLKSYFNRAGDFVFRVGGEEFAAILNIENSDNIDGFIVKLLKNIEDLNIEHKGNPPFGVLTISCGVVVADFAQISKPFSTDEIYKLVDDELYKAKQNGKNRISSFYVF